MKKRIIALALCFVMLLGCLGMGVDALTDTAPLYDRLIAAQTAEEFDAIAESATEEELSALTEAQLVEISNRYAAILGEDAQEPITYASSSVNNVGPLVKKDAVQTKARLAKAKAAASQQDTSEPGKDEGLILDKYATKNDDGTYKLTLESFVTGEVKITQEKLPADIVLVLDVSGSMDDYMPFANSSSDKEELWRIINSLDKEYGKTEGVYKWGNCYMRYKDNKWQWKKNPWTWKDVTEDDMYGDENFYIKKIYALKTATKNFVDQVETKAAEDGVDHRISIVSFANNANDVLPLTVVNSESVVSIKEKIDGLKANGATQSDLGMQHAKSIIDEAENINSNKVVIMFTDGEPESSSWFVDNKSVTNDAIQASWDLKNTYTTTVYTIGVFESGKADDTVPMPSGANDITKYMNYVSSNFKDAWDIDETYTQTNIDKDKPYFKLAGNASEMTEIFDKISEEVSGGAKLDLGTETVLRDIVTADFDIVAPNGIADIKVYTADYIKRGADGERVFAERGSDGWKEYNANVDIKDGNTVEVTGFDYSSETNCVKDTIKNGEPTYSGKKLIVEFNIKVSDSCLGGGWFDTNNNASGIYKTADDNDAVGKFPVPNVNVPRKTFDLTIKKEAAKDTKIDENQTFVFTVKGTDEHIKDVNTQVIIKGDGSVTLKDLPVGKYTVTEDTNWSWRYTPDRASQTVNADSTTPQQTVTFVNELTNDSWLSFLNRVTNVFKILNAS